MVLRHSTVIFRYFRYHFASKFSTSIGSLKKQESSKKTSTSASLTMLNPLTVENKLWKRLKEMGIPDHLTCPLRNLYSGQEATVSTVQ